MNIISKILKTVFPKNNVEIPNNFKNEDEYYTFLFTQHPKWNTAAPNKAEQDRWLAIELIVKKLNLPKTIDIIDFGCGRGWLSYKLSEYGKVTGIEPVANVIDYAKELFPKQDFIVGSINELNNLKADLIICSEVLEHISKVEKPIYFKAFNVSLHKNSYLLITTPRGEVQKEWLQYRNDDGQPIEEWISEFDLQQLANLNGFKLMEKVILQQNANGSQTPLLDLYQVCLFQKNEI